LKSVRVSSASCFPKGPSGVHVGTQNSGVKDYPATLHFFAKHDPMRLQLLKYLVAVCVLCAQSISIAQPTKEPSMTRIATGEFVVKLLPLGVEGQDRTQDSKFGRMSIDKTISGGLVATTVGQMLTAMTDVKGSAGYVAIEKVDGVLDGKKGSFALQHAGTMNRGAPSLLVTVVPDSGTDELIGLAGEFKIIIAGGKHSYEFKYTLP
jgi:hypothetical protein